MNLQRIIIFLIFGVIPLVIGLNFIIYAKDQMSIFVFVWILLPLYLYLNLFVLISDNLYYSLYFKVKKIFKKLGFPRNHIASLFLNLLKPIIPEHIYNKQKIYYNLKRSILYDFDNWSNGWSGYVNGKHAISRFDVKYNNIKIDLVNKGDTLYYLIDTQMKLNKKQEEKERKKSTIISALEKDTSPKETPYFTDEELKEVIINFENTDED